MTVANVRLSSVGNDVVVPIGNQRLPLQFLRLFQQLDHALEQTGRAAAVDTAMIEAERDLCFGLGDKFLFRFVPDWNLSPGAETEEQSLIGQGNRRAPFDPERSEI